MVYCGGLVSGDCFEKNVHVIAILQAILHIFNDDIYGYYKLFFKWNFYHCGKL